MARSPTQTDAKVGERIRFRRRQCKLTQTALAQRVGVSFQQMQKYEKGTNRVGASRLAEIAHVLDVPVSFFFPRSDASTDTDPLASALGDPMSVELLFAFATVQDGRMRRAILDLVKAAGTVGPSHCADNEALPAPL